MAKLTTVRITLILLQLTSVIIASIIIIIYYNPWITRIIDEAERSGNTGQSLADQIRRTDNEELVIFLMSTTTILVSLIGIIGALRNYEHNNCLLNFYMSTLILFLFVVFVALCGTVWEIIGKLHRSTSSTLTIKNTFHHDTPYLTDFDNFQTKNNQSEQYTDENDQIDDKNFFDLSKVDDQLIMSTTTTIATTTEKIRKFITHHSVQAHNQISWLYICKSLLLITFSAILYATSLKLTRKILESSDDRYLSASECDADDNDLNESDGCGALHYPSSATNSSRYPYHFDSYAIDVSDVYHNDGDGHHMIINTPNISKSSNFL